MRSLSELLLDLVAGEPLTHDQRAVLAALVGSLSRADRYALAAAILRALRQQPAP